MELDDVLSDKPEVKVEAEPAKVEKEEPAKEPVKEPVKAEPNRTEDGKFAPKQEEPAKVEPPKQDFSERERAFLARATEETRKRQQLEQRIKELEAKPQEPEKTFWEDPDGAIKNQAEAHQKTIQEVQRLLVTQKMQTAEYHARKQYPDFDEKITEFAVALQETPGLQEQWLSSIDPAEFAYKAGKNRLEYKQLGSLDAVKAKMELEIRQKIEAEYKKKADDAAKERENLPPSLSDVSGVPGQSRAVWGGPTPLGNILNG